MIRNEFQIEDIIAEIDEINEFLEIENCRNLNDFLSNDLLKKAVMMSIINIGEQAKLLSKPFINKYSYINFDQFRDIRNTAAHKYGTVNFVLIWNVINRTLPKFKQQLLHILRKLHVS